MTLKLPPRPFALDPFQRDAVAALDAGRSVLVAAPTGSGKTVVAEYALDRAVLGGRRAFYTSPIKALANQKFRDFSARYGPDRVGLLTGDNSINGDAQVVVMTTEVLRNMLYVDSPALDNLEWVVLDEVHYLQDRYRGPVWEEVILNLAPEVGLVSLSATVSNLDQLGEWLRTVRGPTDVILSTVRPVPLRELLAVADGDRRRIELLPLFVKGKPNPRGGELNSPKGERYRGNRSRAKFRTPRRSNLVVTLRSEDLAPVIYFVFSRAGCDDAARQCAEAGLDFTTADQKGRIAEIIAGHLSAISTRDQASLQIDEWTERAVRGIASHHAGLIPAMKEAVETAFGEGLISVVFATETLALGINMPARTVVIENLSKFNGETHELLTPLEYTQLTGRAGRRGMDTLGHAVTSWSPFVDFAQLSELASSRDFPLKSAFRPTYNMAANLVNRMHREDAEHTVGRSFAQFQVDEDAVRTEQDVERLRRKLAAIEPEIACDFGDVREFVEWDEAEAVASASAEVRTAVIESLRVTKPGHIIAAPGIGYAAVVSTASRKKRGPRLRIVTADGQTRQIDAEDLDLPAEIVAQIELPQPFAPRAPEFHAAVAAELQTFNLGSLASAGSEHPVAQCPELKRHLKALDEAMRIDNRLATLRSRLNRRQGRLVQEFARITDMLERRGYVTEWTLTESGHLLTRLYHESDLLISESLLDGAFDGLDAGEVAALASCFTYEHRSSQPPPPAKFPTAAVEAAFGRLQRLGEDLNRAERDTLGSARTRLPDPGFAFAAFHWATGANLESVIEDVDSGGDFVRNIRQLLDLLRQLSGSGPNREIRRAAGAAAQGLDRGVVKAASDIAALAEQGGLLTETADGDSEG